ncbi:hypothetical protein PR202_gb19235 [Eleusine coracana subsp. coracana]|uniref:Prokaryotic-type class I peptide chain release factors domain-containing protein n=1 Tax=Eleusine coracana subsp. coracana TaxID=191504 RepID=A0AAV5F7J4_ELECO|nr:hypothetical protein PR202_gb19235 [Eleusine coracana subsp. coracana]
MATVMRSAGLLRLGFRHTSSLLFQGPPCSAPSLGLNLGPGRAGLVRLRCLAAGDDGGKKVSARLALTQQVLRDAEERAASAGSDPAPKVTLDHVTVNFARSGGPGGQNVNKVNTKVDMRFNVKEAHCAAAAERKRLQSKKVTSQKKEFRRNRTSWD